MKLEVKKGTTSKRVVIFIQDSSSTTGGGLTGLSNASSGLVWYYWREDTGNAGGTSVSVVSATRGTFTSGGFIEIDSTNLPGFYEIGVPNAVLATGGNWAVMMLKGATNMVPNPTEIQLVDYDPNDAARLGLTNLPAGNMMVKKNTAIANFMFKMKTANGGNATGLTITATRTIDGGALSACANSASELSAGWYTIALSASDVNGNVIGLNFAGSGAIDTTFTIVTQP